MVKQINLSSDQVKSHFKSRRLLITIDMKGQMVAHIAQVTCFEAALKIRRFICPNFFSTGV